MTMQEMAKLPKQKTHLRGLSQSTYAALRLLKGLLPMHLPIISSVGLSLSLRLTPHQDFLINSSISCGHSLAWVLPLSVNIRLAIRLAMTGLLLLKGAIVEQLSSVATCPAVCVSLMRDPHEAQTTACATQADGFPDQS